MWIIDECGSMYRTWIWWGQQQQQQQRSLSWGTEKVLHLNNVAKISAYRRCLCSEGSPREREAVYVWGYMMMLWIVEIINWSRFSNSTKSTCVTVRAHKRQYICLLAFPWSVTSFLSTSLSAAFVTCFFVPVVFYLQRDGGTKAQCTVVSLPLF